MKNQHNRLLEMVLKTNLPFIKGVNKILEPFTYKDFLDLTEEQKELVLNNPIK